MRRCVISVLTFFMLITTLALAQEPLYFSVENFFQPIPKVADNPRNPLNGEKIELGKKLFFDPRLSKSSFISCNTCHNLASGGVDNLPTSIGHKWQVGKRNAPSVFNAAILPMQFWDGRAKDVEEQAKGPILNPGEMASTEKLAVERIKSIPEYVTLFKKAFPGERDPVNFDNIAKAIAAFERTLMTPSRFDFLLQGRGGLTDDELKGLAIFVRKGCVGCHTGAGIGGDTLQRFDYGVDFGKYEVTKNEDDKMMFRVASLRNVEVTYPYFHDGSVWKLEDAIRIMGRRELKLELTDTEVNYLVSFLKSLTGVNMAVEMPVLPPSTEATPPPDIDQSE